MTNVASNDARVSVGILEGRVEAQPVPDLDVKGFGRPVPAYELQGPSS